LFFQITVLPGVIVMDEGVKWKTPFLSVVINTVTVVGTGVGVGRGVGVGVGRGVGRGVGVGVIPAIVAVGVGVGAVVGVAVNVGVVPAIVGVVPGDRLPIPIVGELALEVAVGFEVVPPELPPQAATSETRASNSNANQALPLGACIFLTIVFFFSWMSLLCQLHEQKGLILPIPRMECYKGRCYMNSDNLLLEKYEYRLHLLCLFYFHHLQR
jgi:hypothetical protein